jgi:ribonuclease R
MSPSNAVRRDTVIDLLASHRRALHIHEIATRLGVDLASQSALRRVLDDLSFDGSVVALPGQRFRLSRDQIETRSTEVEGIFSFHPRGFGFVSVPNTREGIYVPPESIGGALHSDTVLVRILTRSRRGIEGQVVRVVKRRTARVAGTLRRRGRSAWIEPDDTRVRGPIVLSSPVRLSEGKDGEAAVALITRFPETADENPEAVLVAVLGTPGDPNVEVAKILIREGIEEEHPEQTVSEAHAFGPEVPPDALIGREDLTNIPLPTIDPEDARDHDDAVWAVREDDGSFKAWIAIADVSYYVRPGTALDASALDRGNSIYLPDRAIPMLPRALSSHLCSLLPQALRLCLCVEVELTPSAEVRKTRIVEGYLRSAAKLTYPGVARALGLSHGAERCAEAEAMKDDLHVMWDLARLLRNRRMRRGALDFDLPEAKVVLDPETGTPLDIQTRAHDPGVKKAYQLIEELMLLANETVAATLTRHNAPAVFRVHGAPDPEKLDRFVQMCHELGVAFDLEDASDPKRLSAFLKRLAPHPQKQVLHMLLLRALKQAAYDVVNIGHFGLASSAYVHVTSPIRRYPDLLVHRTVRALLQKQPLAVGESDMEELRNAARRASDCERRAMEVEREVVHLYGALFMRAHIGSVFEGTVTGLAGTGVFVLLDQPFVDVLVRMESLGPDQYEMDDSGLRVIGTRSGDRIALGDRMLVEIEDVAILRRTVYARRVIDPEDARFGKTRRRRAASEKSSQARHGGTKQARPSKKSSPRGKRR